jgi:hypothetical protein
MSFVKEKTIVVSSEDYLKRDWVCWTEFEHNESRYVVQAVRDNDAENPRKSWDHSWTWSTTRGAGYSDKGAMSLDDYENLSKEERKEYLFAPLGLYRHSGDHVYLGDKDHLMDPGGWDSGQMGVAHIKKSDAAKCFSKNGSKVFTASIKSAALEALRWEIKEMNAWTSGEVYGIILTNIDTEEEEESTWGHFCYEKGDIEDVIKELLPNGISKEEESSIIESLEWR